MRKAPKVHPKASRVSKMTKSPGRSEVAARSSKLSDALLSPKSTQASDTAQTSEGNQSPKHQQHSENTQHHEKTQGSEKTQSPENTQRSEASQNTQHPKNTQRPTDPASQVSTQNQQQVQAHPEDGGIVPGNRTANVYRQSMAAGHVAAPQQLPQRSIPPQMHRPAQQSGLSQQSSRPTFVGPLFYNPQYGLQYFGPQFNDLQHVQFAAPGYNLLSKPYRLQARQDPLWVPFDRRNSTHQRSSRTPYKLS
ncbi:hypothetical protein GGR52DRAFT_109764 [Hypoxylon sp. FL1284]|nr:hypothetical protein GGR52DRAFT_109764 [Hypoxylon sp. FL1284]